MKTLTLLLALGSLLSTAHAQTVPARPKLIQAHATLMANGKAVGRKFVEKSKPYDAPISIRPQPKLK